MRAAMADTMPCSGCNGSIEKLKNGAMRIHFHGGDVGGCGRKTQYSMMFPMKAMGGSDPWFLKDGHFHEEVILNLIKTGASNPHALDESIKEIKIYAAKNDEELYWRVPYKDSMGALKEFVIVGHYDGLMTIEYEDGREEDYVLECKAVKDTTFQKVKAGEISNEWHGQIQTYLHMLNLKTAYLLVKNRTTAEVLPPIRIDYNPKYLKERRQTLAEVHEFVTRDRGALVDREHSSSNNFECSFCKFKTKCWGLDPKEKKNAKTVNKNKGKSKLRSQESQRSPLNKGRVRR